MQYTDERCEILSNRQIADGIFDLTVKADYLAQNAGCGQFANILCGGLMLRRPISICDTDPKAGTARFVYQVKGKGTAWLSQQPAGASLQIFGPLGRGFSFIKKPAQVVLIGGGIGSPPMLKTARTAAELGIDVHVILGFRSRQAVILEQDFKQVAQTVTVCTDDGSYGIHGFVTQALQPLLQQGVGCVMACGPTPMLKNVAGMCADTKTPCFVSLEERMGCGVGACVCCVCKIRVRGFSGYQQVCKSGPVFDGRSVVWYQTKTLESGQFDDAKAVRLAVFCDEQGYDPAAEFDELDAYATHLAVYDGAKPIATGRVLPPEDGVCKIGRIAVLQPYRGRSVGRYLVEDLIEAARQQGADTIRVDAQVQAMPFYQKLGFDSYGEEHPDGHIPHMYMERKL